MVVVVKTHRRFAGARNAASRTLWDQIPETQRGIVAVGIPTAEVWRRLCPGLASQIQLADDSLSYRPSRMVTASSAALFGYGISAPATTGVQPNGWRWLGLMPRRIGE